MIDSKKIKALVDQWLDGKDYFFVDATVDKDNKIVVEIDHKDGVWIEDCCDLSRFIESNLDREAEDFELEVGSAGIGQPFKVVEQYVCNVGREVEVMTLEGKKLTGTLQAADSDGFTLKYVEKQRLEGKKRPVAVDVERQFSYPEAKWVKVVIKF
ncbi:MAG: ribosome assembly cofactor RimP [Bacteroidaceae bacterium]|nr:ribosome assembly cofactor RimP [Bacteroidaceae bacterium]MBQ9175849.1 ribosome assembly cofactor RimP [Bacteroidaceae bacterium]MBR1379198.1 ribosome assembly cofactor RimP [Bacteroidaceae bacterium]